jgi:hypothetical protein
MSYAQDLIPEITDEMGLIIRGRKKKDPDYPELNTILPQNWKVTDLDLEEKSTTFIDLFEEALTNCRKYKK